MGSKTKEHGCKRNNTKKITAKIMAVTLASSMMLTPVINANASTESLLSEYSLTNSIYDGDYITINESAGWLESAYVEWNAIEGATGYNVYYKAVGQADSEYVQLDNELIRQYSSYFRADALGLSTGEYVMKIVPIIDGTEEGEKSVVTDYLQVEENTREGFAFSAESTMGTASGGYNDDGTVQENAQIIYITADNINTVTLDVITNSKGTKTTCTGLVDILAKRQKGIDKTPLIIRMVGEIKDTDISGLNSSGYIQIKGCYNVTFEGVGEDATANGWGFLIRDSKNVELKNVGVMLFKDDAISLDTGNENVWIHNNDIFYGTAGSDADQAKGDGSCDVKGNSTYVTVSYNHFYDSGKCSLCGMSDTENFYVTYHHNWFDHSDSRHPRIRVGTVHIYNNYFDGNSKYGVGVTKGSSAFVEANYFRNCKYPMLSSLQGTDIADGSKGTFSGEAGGMIKAYNNMIEGASSLVYAQDNSTQFDAYLATDRNEEVPSTYTTVSGGTTYNNFDTSSIMYSYEADAVEDVENVVTTYAGRVNGGDFSWTFTTDDDTLYKVNTALMEKIKAYTTSLVSVGGNSIVVGSTDKDETTTDEEDSAVSGSDDAVVDETPTVDNEDTSNKEDEDVVADDSSNDDSIVSESSVHNFTTDGIKDSFFTITGALSSTKGTVEYEGLTLTQCLKIDSAAKITFTTTETKEMTLVFNSTYNKAINIDGEEYTVTNGILTVSLKAGEHVITKENTCNLYYISLK